MAVFTSRLACIAQFLATILLSNPHLVQANSASTVQFCNTDVASPFCVAATSYFNITDDPPKHDLHLSVEFAVPKQSAGAGWTAVGLGGGMAGSLMFVFYGDPNSDMPPTLSLRTTNSHTAPHPVQLESTVDKFDPKPSIRIQKAEWEERQLTLSNRESSFVGRVDIACYSCIKWSETSFSMETHRQPFIWAVNHDMAFDRDFSSNRAHLDRHDEHGVFFADMRAILEAETSAGGGLAVRPPSVDWNAGLTHASTSAGDLPADEDEQAAPWSADYEHALEFRERVILVHGSVMMFAFWFLFPVGAVVIRSGLSTKVRYGIHVGCQMAGAACVLAGALLGQSWSSWSSYRLHQWLGLLVTFLVICQTLSGSSQRFSTIRSYLAELKFIHGAGAKVVLVLGWSNITLALSVISSWRGLVLTSVMVPVSLTVLMLFLQYKWQVERTSQGQRLTTEEPLNASEYYKLDGEDEDGD